MRVFIATILVATSLCIAGCRALAMIDGGSEWETRPSIVNHTPGPLEVEYTSRAWYEHCRVSVAPGAEFLHEGMHLFPPDKDWPVGTVRYEGQEVRIEFTPRGWSPPKTDRFEATIIDGRLTLTPQK